MGKPRGCRNEGMAGSLENMEALIADAIKTTVEAGKVLGISDQQSVYFIGRGRNVQPELVTDEKRLRLVNRTDDPMIVNGKLDFDTVVLDCMKTTLMSALEITFAMEETPAIWDRNAVQNRIRMRSRVHATTGIKPFAYGLAALDDGTCDAAFQKHFETMSQIERGVGVNTGTALPFMVVAASKLLAAAAGGGRDPVDAVDAANIGSAAPALARVKLSTERTYLAYAGPVVPTGRKLAVDIASCLTPATVAMHKMFKVASRRLADTEQEKMLDYTVDIVVPYTLDGIAQLLGASVGAYLAYQNTTAAHLENSGPIPLIQAVVDLPHDYTTGSRLAWAMVDSLHKLMGNLPHVQLFTRPPSTGRQPPPHPLRLMDSHLCVVLMNYIPRVGAPPPAETKDREHIIATSIAITKLMEEGAELETGIFSQHVTPAKDKMNDFKYISKRNMVVALGNIYAILLDPYFKDANILKNSILTFIRPGATVGWNAVLALAKEVGLVAGVPNIYGGGQVRLAVIAMQLLVDRLCMMSIPPATKAMHHGITVGV
jgi:hypothetical protein